MNNTEYALNVSESPCGKLSVSRVSKLVRLNQHRADYRLLDAATFGFADPANPATLIKRAARKTRRLPVGKK